MEPIFQVILTALTSFIICYFSIPSIIKVAKIKNIFDEPCERRRHKNNVPTLGGVAIFGSFIFSITFWANQNQIIELQYIIASLIILFLIGIKDDIIELVAYKKLLGQFFAACILVFFADIRITSLFGLLGVFELPYLVSSMLSLVGIIGITNSFNLIDGIDTLAGSIGALVLVYFGMWFFLSENFQYCIVSFSLVGSLLAFLCYNRTPSKIFMGDTGSLLVGLVASVLAVKFVELNRSYVGNEMYRVFSAPAVALSILIIPIFDTFRVFLLRIMQGRSPFSSDRNHIHHILTDVGFTHIKTTLILLILNIIVSISTLFLMKARGEVLVLFNFSVMFVFYYYFLRLRNRKGAKLKFLKGERGGSGN